MSFEIALVRIQLAKQNNTTLLDLSNLKLSKVPEEISTLTQLKELYLFKNQITVIEGLELLTQLTRLSLSNNQITIIEGLHQLIKLEALFLNDNQIMELKGLDQLTQLMQLQLHNNQITELKGLDRLTQLTQLYLYNNQITELKGLDQLTQLNQLQLYDNQITELKGLDQLTQLTQLNLSNNQLGEIKGLENLHHLTQLSLWGNKFTEIKGLEGLSELKELYLGRNRITEIKGLERLSELIELSLLDNHLTETKGLKDVTQHLKRLSLNDNFLTEINELKQFNKLHQLDVRNNKLTDIPEFLLKMGRSIIWDWRAEKNGIFVSDNPFTNPPPDIIKQGNDAIQEYFRQRKAGGEPLNEAKLILLGDGRSGKTSLASRLLGEPLPTEADRTEGVDIIIGKYSFPLADGKEFKINIWDFAGQDKYKTLHQLFYTDSSVYVMVAESGNTGTDYDDWFQTAELFGEGSPLVLMLNEFKDGIGMGSFDSNYWKKQFPELLKEVFTVNLGKEKSLNFLKAEKFIQLLAQNLTHASYIFPSNWAAIRRILNDRRNEQYITLQEYFKICKENNLPERESALVLSGVLHKVGDCLHYQKSDLLHQYIILKNEWATDAVYKILEDQIVAEKRCGFFDRKDTERIWSSNEYRDMRPQLLELMKQFKLAYQLPGKEEYVTPPLLPPARPGRFSWLDGDSLELYIEYEFLPKALLTQFIVTRHADIADDRTLVWRHGVVLKWEDEAIAEVSKTKLEGKNAFRIRTQGGNRKEMITVILKTFRELHAEYKGIKYKEKVPCICNGCRTKANKQHYFEFGNLQFRLEKRRYEVECDQSLEPVNIMELLENSFVFERYREGEGRELQLKENVKHNGRQTIHLFLASSIELLHEREKIEQGLGRKNKLLKERGFEVELLIWEDGKHIGKSLRSQDNYNLDIEQCDLFAIMFYSKVGKYSLEEFGLASSLFEEKGMPRIRIFQKDADLPKSQSQADSNSRYDFLEQLKKLEHFPTTFDNADKLVNELSNAIDKLLLDTSFVDSLKES